MVVSLSMKVFSLFIFMKENCTVCFATFLLINIRLIIVLVNAKCSLTESDAHLEDQMDFQKTMWPDIMDKKDAPLVSTKNRVFLDYIFSLLHFTYEICCECVYD